MSVSRLQSARALCTKSFVVGAIVLSISPWLSRSVFAQMPASWASLPDAPSAKGESSIAQQSNTSRDGSDRPYSTTSGKETLTEQADYFVPMTTRERWDHYVYSLVGPQTVLYTTAQAGINQAQNTPHEWGQGAEGYGRRFGSAYGEHIVGATVGNGVALALHEDNRYFKSGKTGLGRLTYAISSALLARHDNGSRSISLSAIGGLTAGAFISREWQPRSTNSAGDAAVSFGYAIASRAGFNVLREFLPKRLERFLK